MKHFRWFLFLVFSLGALGAQAQQEEPDYVRVRVETLSGGWRGDIGDIGVFYGSQPMFKDREGYYHCRKNREYNIRPPAPDQSHPERILQGRMFCAVFPADLPARFSGRSHGERPRLSDRIPLVRPAGEPTGRGKDRLFLRLATRPWRDVSFSIY